MNAPFPGVEGSFANGHGKASNKQESKFRGEAIQKKAIADSASYNETIFSSPREVDWGTSGRSRRRSGFDTYVKTAGKIHRS